MARALAANPRPTRAACARPRVRSPGEPGRAVWSLPLRPAAAVQATIGSPSAADRPAASAMSTTSGWPRRRGIGLTADVPGRGSLSATDDPGQRAGSGAISRGSSGLGGGLSWLGGRGWHVGGRGGFGDCLGGRRDLDGCLGWRGGRDLLGDRLGWRTDWLGWRDCDCLGWLDRPRRARRLPRLTRPSRWARQLPRLAQASRRARRLPRPSASSPACLHSYNPPLRFLLRDSAK